MTARREETDESGRVDRRRRESDRFSHLAEPRGDLYGVLLLGGGTTDEPPERRRRVPKRPHELPDRAPRPGDHGAPSTQDVGDPLDR
jgi:hypothetical protein